MFFSIIHDGEVAVSCNQHSCYGYFRREIKVTDLYTPCGFFLPGNRILGVYDTLEILKRNTTAEHIRLDNPGYNGDVITSNGSYFIGQSTMAKEKCIDFIDMSCGDINRHTQVNNGIDGARAVMDIAMHIGPQQGLGLREIVKLLSDTLLFRYDDVVFLKVNDIIDELIKRGYTGTPRGLSRVIRNDVERLNY